MRTQKLSYYKKRGFTGIDVNIATSLYDYGLIHKYSKKHDEYEFIYPVYSYNTTGYTNNWLSEDEVNMYITDPDTFINVRSFLNTIGMTKENWLNLPIVSKVYDLINHCGYLRIFGKDNDVFNIVNDI